MSGKRLSNSLYYIEGSLLLLGLLTLQFYFRESGSMQISHAILSLFFLSSLSLHKWTLATLEKPLTIFTGFTLYAITVNLCIYAFSPATEEVLKSSLFLIFNWSLLVGICRFSMRHTTTERLLVIGLSVPILIALLLYLFGVGNYLFEPRYAGMFKDPNQMAFWVLCSLSSVLLLTRSFQLSIPLFLISIVLCLASMSRSALIGLVPLSIGLYVKLFVEIGNKKTRLFALMLLTLSLLLIGLYLYRDFTLSEESVIRSFLDRISSTEIKDQMGVRGYHILKEYPEYLFFGAGQGDFDRFNLTQEIHSTWLGLLFYYGIIGLLLFASSLVILMRRLRVDQILIALAPLFYGVTTYGARTPIFYIFVATLFILYKRQSLQQVALSSNSK